MVFSRRVSRRRFLQNTSAVAGAAIAAPYLVPQRAFGANEKINVGHIGVRGQGRAHFNMGQAVAVCDVDKQVLAAAQKTLEKKSGKCESYTDFRKMLERKDLDAVVTATPDHWHALITIHACEAGKDVYCEKPLTLCIAEGRAMVDAARRNKRIVQTGSQQRSDKRFRYACELVRNGRLGKIEKVEVGIPGCNHPGVLGPDSDPPEWLDYNMWLGPAPYRPYNEKRVHYNFRFWLDYSGGQMTNWGAHHLDITQWALGMDDSGPIRTEGTGEFDAEKRFTVPARYDITHTYANGVKVHVGQKYRGGVTFFGSEGKVFVTRGKIESEPGEIIEKPIAESEIHLYNSKSHHQNFLDCIKSRELPICDVEIGHRSATVCHLGNLCALAGRSIQWDPAKEQVVGDEEVAKMVRRDYRAPWKLEV